MARKPAASAEERADIEAKLRAWLAAHELTAAAGAERLGVSVRTIEGVLQGRGFVYPRLLELALRALS